MELKCLHLGMIPFYHIITVPAIYVLLCVIIPRVIFHYRIHFGMKDGMQIRANDKEKV